jgi:hypothetical protein
MHIGRRRDEKAKGSGLQLCFGLFVVFYKIGCLKDAARDEVPSRVKDSENLLKAPVTIAMGGGSYVDPSLLSKMEVFIKKKKCKPGISEPEMFCHENFQIFNMEDLILTYSKDF